MRKKPLLFAGALCVLAGCLCALFLSKERPIVAQPESAEIIELLHILNASGDSEPLVGYDESALLEYFSSCTEKRTLQKASTVPMGNYDFIITLREGDAGLKTLYLSSFGPNHTSTGNGDWLWEVQDGTQAIQYLSFILELY